MSHFDDASRNDVHERHMKAVETSSLHYTPRAVAADAAANGALRPARICTNGSGIADRTTSVHNLRILCTPYALLEAVVHTIIFIVYTRYIMRQRFISSNHLIKIRRIE